MQDEATRGPENYVAMAACGANLLGASSKASPAWFQVRRQHPIDPYFADFACISLKLDIEIDGDHASKWMLTIDVRWRWKGADGV